MSKENLYSFNCDEIRKDKKKINESVFEIKISEDFSQNSLNGSSDSKIIIANNFGNQMSQTCSSECILNTSFSSEHSPGEINYSDHSPGEINYSEHSPGEINYVRSNEFYLAGLSDVDDWICDHEEFPFCDCISKCAGRSTSFSPWSYKEIEPRGRSISKRFDLENPLPSISLVRDVRDCILEVLEEAEETDSNDLELEGAVALIPTDHQAGLLIPIAAPGDRRASIVTSESRRGSLLPELQPIKIAVFGKDGVGKSALIVRLVTGRFIGEYDPSMEAIYNYQIPLPGHELPLQVMDTAGTVDVAEEGRECQVSWGEGFLLVFSLTNHKSLTALQHIRRVLVDLTPGSPRPFVLVGNKADLSHAREVTSKEILELADLWGCDYFEVSAAEPWDVVVRPFLAIYQAVLDSRRQ